MNGNGTRWRLTPLEQWDDLLGESEAQLQAYERTAWVRTWVYTGIEWALIVAGGLCVVWGIIR